MTYSVSVHSIIATECVRKIYIENITTLFIHRWKEEILNSTTEVCFIAIWDLREALTGYTVDIYQVKDEPGTRMHSSQFTAGAP